MDAGMKQGSCIVTEKESHPARQSRARYSVRRCTQDKDKPGPSTMDHVKLSKWHSSLGPSRLPPTWGRALRAENKSKMPTIETAVDFLIGGNQLGFGHHE